MAKLIPMKPVASTFRPAPVKPDVSDARTSPDDVVANREHRIYKARKEAIRVNLLALSGGQPYIDERLTRFPGESNIDWGGSEGLKNQKRFDAMAYQISGRKDRAYLVNHAARVAEKIRQYVFAAPPERPAGVNAELQEDITRKGKTLNQFMGQVLEQIIACKWCWLGVDAPEINGPVSITRARGEKIRPYWTLYSAYDVVDWHFNERGELEWLLTEGVGWDNANPLEEENEQTVRRLWQPQKVTTYVIERVQDKGDAKVTQKTAVDVDFPGVPFILAGNISEAPHWFDDVEAVQRSTLDLESCLDTLFHKVVFAQLVLPASMANAASGEGGSGQQMSEVVAAIAGYCNAFVESSEDKGIARFIGPPAGAIGTMQEELKRKREQLFDTVGLHLGFTRRFSEAKEATEFDHLDPQAVLRNYAQQITEAETKAWKFMANWSSTVSPIVPHYADKFKVTSIYEDFKALTLAMQMDLPDSMSKLTLRGILDTLLEITKTPLTDAERQKMLDEIEEYQATEPIDLMPGTNAQRVVDGVQQQATDDGEGVRASGAE